MSLVSWAKAELDRIPKDEDGMQELVNQNIMELLEVFAKQGHSGMSANYVMRRFDRLAQWKPLAPLTGEDDEWGAGWDGTEQNKRCSYVFREKGDNATAYDSQGKIFSDNGGKSWYTCGESRVPITFPYAVPDEPERVMVEPE